MVFGLDKNLMVKSALKEKKHLVLFGMLQKLRDYERQHFSKRRQKKSAKDIKKNISLRWAKVTAFFPRQERFTWNAYWKFTLFKINVKEIASLIREKRSIQVRIILNNWYFSVFYQVSYFTALWTELIENCNLSP